jgi:hypothetical protein
LHIGGTIFWYFPIWFFAACFDGVGQLSVQAWFALQLFSFVLVFVCRTSGAFPCSVAKGTQIAARARRCSGFFACGFPLGALLAPRQIGILGGSIPTAGAFFTAPSK